MELLQEGESNTGRRNFPHKNKSTVCPPLSTIPAVKIFFEMVKQDIEALPPRIGLMPNLTTQEQRALSDLRSNKEFLIREADKGGNVVLWPHSLYLEEASRQLCNQHFYRRLPSNPTGVFSTKLRALLDRSFELGVISVQERDFIWVEEPTTSTFYMLPKVHKDLNKPPGRPIVSSIGSLCEKACIYIDFFLQPFVLKLPSHIRDSSHFISIYKRLDLSSGEIMVTCDVESLYSNISHDDGLQAIMFFLDQQTNSDRMHDSFIIDLLDFVLRHNFFLFDRTFYIQTSGVAMGARCAPAFENLFLGWWEHTVVYVSNFFINKVRHWSRFIDDIFFIWSGSIEECLEFLDVLNHNPFNIILTHQFSSVAVQFVDLEVKCQNGKLSTCLYRKPTAVNSLLEYRSFHPKHTRDGIPRGQFLRARRNCTDDEDFRREAHDLTERFRRRNYPKKCISRAYQRAKIQTQDTLLVPTRKETDKFVRFITGYHTQWNQVRDILNNHWRILTADTQTAQVISPRPLVIAKRAPNFRDILTRSHYSRPTHKLNRGIVLKGSFPCGNCTVCTYMHPTRDSFINPTDQTPHRLKSYINCKTSNVIYAIICTCPRVYVGQTTQELRRRIQGHFSTINTAVADRRKGFLG
ncbi:uncharacterized protein [Ranitomeya imitator]|uniref:uncharacterized protein n=1 Tax=Ranitomeya imitator TaxID=111125 RepID=UPI0037E91B14